MLVRGSVGRIDDAKLGWNVARPLTAKTGVRVP